MCGRYVSASPPDELARYFGAQTGGEQLEESYNVAPTDAVYGVRARDGHRQLETLRWGLVPFWAKDPKIGSRMINARAESVADKLRRIRAVAAPAAGNAPGFDEDEHAQDFLTGVSFVASNRIGAVSISSGTGARPVTQS